MNHEQMMNDMMSGGMMHGGMMSGGTMHSGMMVLPALFGFLLIAFAVAAMFVAYRSTQYDRYRSSWSALDELDRRYAIGDLSRDEYFERRGDLSRA